MKISSFDSVENLFAQALDDLPCEWIVVPASVGYLLVFFKEMCGVNRTLLTLPMSYNRLSHLILHYPGGVKMIPTIDTPETVGVFIRDNLKEWLQ